MTRAFSLLTLSLLGLTMVGCVSQEKYNAQRLRGDQLAEQLAAANSQVNTATGQYEVLKHQLEMIRNSGDNKDALIANQVAQISDLSHQLEDMNSRYRSAMDLAGKAGSGPLPAVLTNELTAFAAQNPDIVDFDSARGLVKFKSDVTFSPGSAEVTPAARTVIDRFATILNSGSAGNYDLMVVGHTDSQPVSNPATISAGHKDNWYLSAHRAIGVARELMKQNVSAGRVEVAGYADQRPVESNATPAGMAKNRRVEVLILPTTGHTGAVAASPAAPQQPRRQAPRRDLNKDATVGGNLERGPIINK